MNEILSAAHKHSAEQREKEISEMKNAVLGFAIKHKTSMDAELAVRALHEAGYRKVEGGEA